MDLNGMKLVIVRMSSGMYSLSECDKDGKPVGSSQMIAAHPDVLAREAFEAGAVQVLHAYDESRILFRPRIVTLCGSTRFFAEFLRRARAETLAGKIVLMPGVFEHHEINAGYPPLTLEGKRSLDSLHFEKIRMSDEVFVVNVDGYIGESTANEIQFTKRLGLPIGYLVEPR